MRRVLIWLMLLTFLPFAPGCAMLQHIVAVGFTTFLRLRNRAEERVTLDEKIDMDCDDYNATGSLPWASDRDGRDVAHD